MGMVSEVLGLSPSQAGLVGGQGPEDEAGATMSLRPWRSLNFVRGLVCWRTRGASSWPRLAAALKAARGHGSALPCPRLHQARLGKASLRSWLLRGPGLAGEPNPAPSLVVAPEALV